MISTWSRVLFLLAVSLTGWGGERVAAQPGGAEPDMAPLARISLAEALRLFESNNLRVRIARANVMAAEGRAATAGALTNPGLTATREQLSREDGRYDETVITVGQILEVGGQRGARVREARSNLAAASALLDAERVGLAFEVHRAYIAAAAAEADLAVFAEATEVFRRVEESGQIRFAEGDISRFERGRLQIERARYETLLAEKSLELQERARELALLVVPDSLTPGAGVLPAEPLSAIASEAQTLTLDESLRRVVDRAEVRSAEAALEAARATLSLARRGRVPNVTVSGGVKHQADGFQGAVIGLAVPVPLWNRNGGEIAAAEAGVIAAEAKRDLAAAAVRNEIRAAWATHLSFEERVRRVGETLLPESAGLLEIARVAYGEGEMTLVELLDAAEAYRTARESVNGLLSNYLVAQADLRRATGRLLDDSAAPAAPAAR